MKRPQINHVEKIMIQNSVIGEKIMKHILCTLFFKMHEQFL